MKWTSFEGKLLIFAIWYVVWLILFAGFCVLIDWDSTPLVVVGIVPLVFAILCMTPLPRKFFSFLWWKIKNAIKKS